MKINRLLLMALIAVNGVLLISAAPSQSISIPASDSEKVSRQLKAILPQLVPGKDDVSGEELIRSAAIALARSGNFQAAQKKAEMIPQRKWDFNIRDEVQRLLVRRLAQQGNIEAALKNTAEIKGEYSRADSLMAIARAHLRAKNKPGALGVLRTAEPIIRTSKSAQTMAYLAWLLIQSGDEKTARSLFALANKTKSNQRFEVTLGDHGKQSIAFYQTKAGWLDEALATAGTNPANLVSIQAELRAQRKWKTLHQLAAK